MDLWRVGRKDGGMFRIPTSSGEELMYLAAAALPSVYDFVACWAIGYEAPS